MIAGTDAKSGVSSAEAPANRDRSVAPTGVNGLDGRVDKGLRDNTGSHSPLLCIGRKGTSSQRRRRGRASVRAAMRSAKTVSAGRAREGARLAA